MNEQEVKAMKEIGRILGKHSRPIQENAKPTDEITITLTRDDAVGLCYSQVKGGHIVYFNHGLFMRLAEFALNRPVYNTEYATDGGFDEDITKAWEEVLKRVHTRQTERDK